MPELPEVETLVRDLKPHLRGRHVTAAQVFWDRTIAAPTPEEFIHEILGKRFETFGRRGKYMLLGMDGGRTLIIHLRMTGKPFLLPTGSAPDKHTHVVLDLDDGRSLHYSDSRKFGRFWLARDADEVVGKLGPEPLDDSFNAEQLASKLAGRKAAIKALLLDQSIVAGVGNIYADEALFRAGIHPARSGGDLSQAEVERLAEAIRVVLRRAIELCGSTLGASSIQNYLRLNGAMGGFQDEHQVYGREDAACVQCGQPIRRIVLAQRSSHFCPHCQPGNRGE